MFFKSKKVIGLDIGSSSIKLAEMDVSGKGAQLLSFGFAPTPPNAVSGGEIVDIASVGIAIQQLINEVKTKRKIIATAMWGTAVIVKKITIPKMDRKLIKDQIRFEAEQYIPFDINNISLAHHILNSSASPDAMDILLIAAQNELVTQYTQVIEVSGLTCGVLDVSGFALANAFELNYGKIPGEVIGILNFGASITNFVVLQNGEVIFCRDIPVGGANYTNEIHKAMGVTVAEAEALKLSAISRREVPDEVHSIISATNEAVTEEIRSSLDFLSATTNGLVLSRCFYTGGSSATSGLVETVSRVTGIMMEPFNPFLRVKANPKKFSPEYLDQISSFAGVVTGLALREQGDAT
ncbi:type IV pilus assembly protein PilM [Bdellovibrio bacteriovorus]|uniref:Fimbrial assembly membrane protein n=1 Tax=Bdellovibrio bacteriovorus (strain ATCC 15356 / DSM 50701 / NCIMB 9529 / HD100) TaxID=264462 RepID=Q6MPJ0_BDEBA|nr:type IV pilus assembly protein PilM [Bdellovibrio bacteriovorus]AHZ86917.1 fimbrial assembly protein [Bdellovibrio bacteriovorus]BEV67358.1 Cell division protein FtsA [Bdellovibrio bacteriovorus]CAE78808.1 fimbrial assembly membrane protein [Bdellovibrio bacteriovorus HD100]